MFAVPGEVGALGEADKDAEGTVKAVEALADKACACPDRVCAGLVQEESYKVDSVDKGGKAARAKIDAASQRLSGCVDARQ